MKFTDVKRRKLVQTVPLPSGIRAGLLEYADEYEAVVAGVDLHTAAGMVGGVVRKVPREILHKFYGEIEPTKLYDLSGRGNHGVPYGGVKLVWDKRWAMEFDGDDDYVEVPHSDSIAPTTAFSLEAMLKIPQGAGEGKGIGIVTKGNVPSDYDYMLYKGYAQGLSIFIKDSGGNAYSATYSVRHDDNLWHHVIGTFDGRYLRLYVDGVLRATSDTGGVSVRVTTNPLNIGRGWSGYFQGQIGFVRIYNRALSDEEIQQNYKAAFDPSVMPVIDGSLVLWIEPDARWRWIGARPTRVYDRSNNRNDGQVNGARLVWDPEIGRVVMSFDGDDYVIVASPTSLPTSDDSRTIEVLTKPHVHENRLWVWWGESTSNKGNGLRLITGMTASGYGIRYYFWGNDLDVDTGNLVGKWHHIVGWYSKSVNQQRIYVDLELRGSRTPTVPDTSYSDVYIGVRISTEWFIGEIAFVRIYDRALSESEIRQNYEAWLNNDPESVVKEGLVLWLEPHLFRQALGIRTFEPHEFDWNAIVDEVKYSNRVARLKLLKHATRQVRLW